MMEGVLRWVLNVSVTVKLSKVIHSIMTIESVTDTDFLFIRAPVSRWDTLGSK